MQRVRKLFPNKSGNTSGQPEYVLAKLGFRQRIDQFFVDSDQPSLHR